jgi:hypothetical protein
MRSLLLAVFALLSVAPPVFAVSHRHHDTAIESDRVLIATNMPPPAR